ncbi:MAG: methyltransferase domain-containing protein [Candidatus Anstonellales archaeon]
MELHIPRELRKLKRATAVVLPKDFGLMAGYAMIDKSKVVLEAGTGTGFLCYMLSGIAKKVVSYEERPEFYENAKKNLAGRKNVVLRNASIEKAKEKADVIILDMKDAPLMVPKLVKNLKKDGMMVGYLPNAEQISAFAKACRNSGAKDVFVVESIVRDFQTEPGFRPFHIGLMHTAYLCFASW